jgi:hypothetical protein
MEASEGLSETKTTRREEILRRWNSYELSFEERDALLNEIMQDRELDLYPSVFSEMDEWEAEAGLYPDVQDPKFTEKLMRKQEFAENKQLRVRDQMEDQVNPCDPNKEFELTPVQRFVGRFLSPQCPYLSALLFHGVGVGKTCAAITIAENFLRSFPRKTVIIVAPRNIQPGFRRTIFDDETLKISEDPTYPNTVNGCTGDAYLKRTGTEFEKNPAVVISRIKSSINSRYVFLGYLQFHRLIDDALKKVPRGLEGDAKKAAERRILRREFSGRLVIIDEAHNLRDTPAEGGDDVDVPGGEFELSETAAGKKLTPSLLKVLDATEGMKLVLLSGTPMYNSYREIVFLLKLLLINDKRITLAERDIFASNGTFKRGDAGRPGGEDLLGAAAAAYISFMRGENPLSFPVRLKPEGVPPLTTWPERSPSGREIRPEEITPLLRLPFIPIEFEGPESKAAYQRISEESIEAGGVGVGSIDEMVQSGNWLFPTEAGPQIRDAGFDASFEENAGGGTSQFTSRAGPEWLQADRLGPVSPKAKFVLQRSRSAKGIVFVYSRFIKSGALPLALALEANGYTPWGDKRPLLTNGGQGPEGRQCALCTKKERAHAGANHKFMPAKYILITGRASISPNNPAAIQASRAKTNMDGRDVKIIIGSQVASEGVDFRFVREIYVFDSWFHLNKMEQVLGRGIRTCSHSLLPPDQRNCTTYLLVNTFGDAQDTETADLYMYRNAMQKAIQVGRVTRVLKRYALDCNLNRDAIIVTGLATQRHVDSQGAVREEVDVNDTPFTNLCDWIETCDYTCARPVQFDPEMVDLSTYDEYAVRWRETELKSAMRKLFEQQGEFHLSDLLDLMSDIPPKAVSALLSDIVGNHSFNITMGGKDGYIVYRNGYFLFQPDYLADIRIPLALRIADFPVKRDFYDPAVIQLREVEDIAAVAATTEAAARAADEEPEGAATAAAPSDTFMQYWQEIKIWAAGIKNGTVPTSTLAQPIHLPETIYCVRPGCTPGIIQARYVGGEIERERSWLIMIGWLYEHIQNNAEFSPEQKSTYRSALARTLVELVWDESIRPIEQLRLLKDETARRAGQEQIVVRDAVEGFRYIDPMTGSLKYICGANLCSDAVARKLDSNPADPLLTLKVDTLHTGAIYGFIVPKSKERRLIFKTSKPPAPGGKPEKGGECSIISTISYHIAMLKEIAVYLTAEGYPRFILQDSILDSKQMIKKAKADAKAAGTAPPENPIHKDRIFENAIRACALKNIILRWMTNMQDMKEGEKKQYFYRPIAALKTGHKGIISKQ